MFSDTKNNFSVQVRKYIFKMKLYNIITNIFLFIINRRFIGVNYYFFYVCPISSCKMRR